MSIEVVDFTEVSDADQAAAIEEAEPCEDCGTKDHLALVLVTSGDGSGEFLIACKLCHLEIIGEQEESFD